jgi:hypothetical protein
MPTRIFPVWTIRVRTGDSGAASPGDEPNAKHTIETSWIPNLLASIGEILSALGARDADGNHTQSGQNRRMTFGTLATEARAPGAMSTLNRASPDT